MENRVRSPIHWKSISDSDKKRFWSSIDSVIADCDGVLWLGNNLIPGSEKVINGLKEKGKTTFLFSNNSSIAPKTLADKSKKLGFDVTEENILVPSSLISHYLKSLNFKKKIYVLGSEDFEKDLKNGGFECFGAGPDYFHPSVSGEHFDDSQFDLTSESDVGAVVVGHDFHFSYVKLFKACQFLANPDCLFIGAAPDVRYPFSAAGSNGSKMTFAPAGCFVNAVASVSNRVPIIMGKPERIAVEVVFKTRGLLPERSLMIGDSLNTDIPFGNRTGMKTLLVLSGMTKSVKDEKFVNEGTIPTYYTESLADLIDSL